MKSYGKLIFVKNFTLFGNQLLASWKSITDGLITKITYSYIDLMKTIRYK